MKERPIIFSGPMVRAIIEGRKTQTRRLVKPRDSASCAPGAQVQHEVHPALLESGEWGWIFDGCTYGIIGRCPYGAAGGRLWVRETWCICGHTGSPFLDSLAGVSVDYRAGPEDAELNAVTELPVSVLSQSLRSEMEDCFTAEQPPFMVSDRWRPSIHMPRWASRIDLEVTGIRVERLQEISEEDAMSEGCWPCKQPDRGGFKTPGDYFAELWESLNSKRAPWASNPWVWAVEFAVAQP